MTTLEDRVRRVGQELNRASATYVERAPGAAYVKAAPAPARRPRVVVVVSAALAVCVVALLVIQRSEQQSSTVTEPPDGLAISATVGGDTWLWPSADSGIIAASADEVAREFAARVLRLPDVVVINESTDGGAHPTVVRIETPTLRLALLVSPQGSPNHWVLHQINNSTSSQSAKALTVPSPANASTAELFVRYAKGVHGFSLPVDPEGGVVELPLQDFVSAIVVVFRNGNGDVIDVRGGDFHTGGAVGPSVDVSTDLAPRFIRGGKAATASTLHSPTVAVGSR